MVFFGMNVIEVKGMEIRIELLGLMTTLIGPTNSGKTVFAKKLCNKIDNSDVFIDGKKITEYDIKYLRENIAVVLDDDNYENEINKKKEEAMKMNLFMKNFYIIKIN